MNKVILGIWNILVSCICYSLGIVATVFGLLIAVPALLLRARSVPPFLSFFWSRFLFLFTGKTVRVTGRENIKKGKAYLVVANHSSFLDIPGIITVLPDVIWVGREKLFRIPLFGTFLKMWGSIPIDTKSVMRSGDAISSAVYQAQRARSVVIFPEGTRTLDGKTQEFKRGFTRILRNSDLDVLPLTLNGFYTLCPKDRWVLNFSKPLEIIIHPPIPRNELIEKTDREIADAVRAVVMENHKGW